MSSRPDKDSSLPEKGDATDMRQALAQLLSGETGIEFAVLVGSRATGTTHSGSDWDIALQWDAQLDWLEILGKTETLRRKMAAAIGVTPDKIDLIELRRANLAMRAEVAESGSLLLGEDTLAWGRFLTRTWRELEDFYWERQLMMETLNKSVIANAVPARRAQDATQWRSRVERGVGRRPTKQSRMFSPDLRRVTGSPRFARDDTAPSLRAAQAAWQSSFCGALSCVKVMIHAVIANAVDRRTTMGFAMTNLFSIL